MSNRLRDSTSNVINIEKINIYIKGKKKILEKEKVKG